METPVLLACLFAGLIIAFVAAGLLRPATRESVRAWLLPLLNWATRAFHGAAASAWRDIRLRAAALDVDGENLSNEERHAALALFAAKRLGLPSDSSRIKRIVQDIVLTLRRKDLTS